MKYGDDYNINRLKTVTIPFNGLSKNELHNKIIKNIVALANTRGGRLILGYTKIDPNAPRFARDPKNELMDKNIVNIISTVKRDIERFVFIDNKYFDDNVFTKLAKRLQRGINYNLADTSNFEGNLPDYFLETPINYLKSKQDKYINTVKSIIEDYINPDDTRLEIGDIRNIINLVVNKIKYRVTSDDLIESIKFDSMLDNLVLIFNIKKGDKPPYKTYKNIHKTKDDFYNLKDYHSVENKKGHKKIYKRTLFDYKYYTDPINREDYEKKLKQNLKYNKGSFSQGLKSNQFNTDKPIYKINHGLGSILISDMVFDHFTIFKTITDGIIDSYEVPIPKNYIKIKGEIVVKGSIKFQLIALYFYLDEYADRFFNKELKHYKDIIAELLLNPLIHRDYSINKPIKIIRKDRSLEIISPGGLQDDVNIEYVQFPFNKKRGSESISLKKVPRNPKLYEWAQDFKSDKNCNYDLTNVVNSFYNNNEYNKIYLVDGIDSFRIKIINNQRSELYDQESLPRKIELLKVLKDRRDAYAKSDGLSKKELYDKLDWNIKIDTLRRSYLTDLIDDDLIKRTIPDKPTSKNQKYKITSIGIKKLKKYSH